MYGLQSEQTPEVCQAMGWYFLLFEKALALVSNYDSIKWTCSQQLLMPILV